MPINYSEIIQVISDLANEENIKVTVKESAKAAVITGALSFVGGLLMGPRGLAIGGVAGSLLAYNMTKDSFRSLGDVIVNDLSEAQKQNLAQRIIKAVKDVHPTDLVMIASLIRTDLCIKQLVFKTVTNFVSNELQIQVID